MLWEELRQDEFKPAVEAAGRVCLLPIGCVESHGIHLPLACDVMHVYHQCKLAAEKESAVVFPPLYFGEKSGAGEHPGTIIFPEILIHQILEQCCKEIYRNGFKKILIVSGHGGNTNMLNNFARSTLQTRTGYLVFVLNPTLNTSYPKALLANIEKYPYLTAEDIEVLEAYGDKRGGHGCFTETGWMYDARPDLTRLDLMNAKDGTNRHVWDEFGKRSIYSPFGWMANFPDSLSADYHEGMNERIAHAMTEASVNNLADVISFLKEETISENFYNQWAEKNPLI
ncbi:MAG: creatininase family protein [Clostridia bacterium]|nr:creatininase family protein [Clostridia bacterium]